MAANKDNTEGKVEAKIDRLVHEPARFMIMAHLFVVDSADFLFIFRNTGLTWGNLSSHMRKLEAGGYIAVEKEFLDKKPHTMVRLTDAGRNAFIEYRKRMQRILEAIPNV